MWQDALQQAHARAILAGRAAAGREGAAELRRRGAALEEAMRARESAGGIASLQRAARQLRAELRAAEAAAVRAARRHAAEHAAADETIAALRDRLVLAPAAATAAADSAAMGAAHGAAVVPLPPELVPGTTSALDLLHRPGFGAASHTDDVEREPPPIIAHVRGAAASDGHGSLADLLASFDDDDDNDKKGGAA